LEVRLRGLPDQAEALAQALDLASEHQRSRLGTQQARQHAHGRSEDGSHWSGQERAREAYNGSRPWQQAPLPDVGGGEFGASGGG
jgi:hypothetical protein